MLKLLQELLLHAHIVIGDRQHSDSISTRGWVSWSPTSTASRVDCCAAPKQLFLKEDECRLGVL